MMTMPTPPIEQSYSYVDRSVLEHPVGRPSLRLATSGGLDGHLFPVAHPFFYSGFVANPDPVAAGLLAVATVARTRYYIPQGMLASILRAADPVVTSSPHGLRFESFSTCAGVYARLDIEAGALDTEHQANGVTNVDMNPPMRQALAGLRPGEPLHLSVGKEALRVRTLDAEATEEKVALPRRWVKGFCEVQAAAFGMELVHELDAHDARRFLGSVPRTNAGGSVLWATAAARSLRLASRPSVGAVPLAGPERLRALEPLMRFATALRVFTRPRGTDSSPGAAAWVLLMPGASLTLTLSPEKSRGFPGEGQALEALAAADTARATEHAARLAAALSFEPRIDVGKLADRTGIAPAEASAALAVLASSGQVGFDVAAGAYFHRPLPLETGDLHALHPRLHDAQRLIDAGAVSLVEDPARDPVTDTAQDAATYAVRSGGTEYRVRLRRRMTDSCSCPWFAAHRGGRGPCKHVLAARMYRAESAADHLSPGS